MRFAATCPDRLDDHIRLDFRPEDAARKAGRSSASPPTPTACRTGSLRWAMSTLRLIRDGQPPPSTTPTGG